MLKFPLLFEWNPALKADCSGILPGYFYCIAAYNSTNLPSPPTVTNQPYPMKAGTAKNCTAWYKKEDGDTCDLIVEMFGTFDKAQFVAWNPAVGVKCIGLEVRILPSPQYPSSFLFFLKEIHNLTQLAV